MAPGKFEPLEPEEPRKCYGNQVGCILRECASINDDDLRSKEHLTQLLLTKLHKRFKFPDRDDNIEQPWDDPKMKKINNHARAGVKEGSGRCAQEKGEEERVAAKRCILKSVYP